jgi:chromosome segregation ATPase
VPRETIDVEEALRATIKRMKTEHGEQIAELEDTTQRLRARLVMAERIEEKLQASMDEATETIKQKAEHISLYRRLLCEQARMFMDVLSIHIRIY